MYYATNELYHHGIKGQKWGVRRYQNPDGTLTEEGKRRYAKNPAYQYRDRYGNLTEKGKTREKEFEKNFTFETNDADFDREENRIRDLFKNSSDPELRKPETWKKITFAWSSAVYEAGSPFTIDSLPEKTTKKLKSLEEKMSNMGLEAERIWGKYRFKHEISKEEYEKHPITKKFNTLRDQYDKEYDKVVGIGKMRTMNDIMKQITPEMRDAVYDMMSYTWAMD